MFLPFPSTYSKRHYLMMTTRPKRHKDFEGDSSCSIFFIYFFLKKLPLYLFMSLSLSPFLSLSLSLSLGFWILIHSFQVQNHPSTSSPNRHDQNQVISDNKIQNFAASEVHVRVIVVPPPPSPFPNPKKTACQHISLENLREASSKKKSPRN